MNRTASKLSHPVLVALAILSAASLAHARNDTLMLPIEPVLRQHATREALGSDITIRFGLPVPQGVELFPTPISGHGQVKPHVGYNFNREIRLTDEQACQQAFRAALVEMVKGVRQGGGTALVGVVSNYRGMASASPVQFECHAGSTKAVVDLQGHGARGSVTATAAQAPVAAKPAALRGAGEEGSEEQRHHKEVPLATGYAMFNDADAVPVREDGKARYRHYLTLPSPKAFVVYEGGGWRFFWNDPDAMTKALDRCAQDGKRCWLYAVDDRIVWSADADKRVGSSAELRGR